MKLTVHSYNEIHYAHRCYTEDGESKFVDLEVNGDLKDNEQELIGKTVWVDSLYPFVEIAQGVKILEEGSDEEKG